MLETWQSDENGIYKPDNGFARFVPNSISKKYNLDLNEFFEANPEASNGLQLEQILKIPFKEVLDGLYEQTDSSNRLLPCHADKHRLCTTDILSEL